MYFVISNHKSNRIGYIEKVKFTCSQAVTFFLKLISWIKNVLFTKETSKFPIATWREQERRESIETEETTN